MYNNYIIFSPLDSNSLRRNCIKCVTKFSENKLYSKNAIIYKKVKCFLQQSDLFTC